MGRLPKSPKLDSASSLSVSRRALFETGVSAGIVTAAAGYGGALQVDVEAFKTFISIVSSGDPNGFENMPRDQSAEVALNDPQATYAYGRPR